jgi:hypothetical protein
MNWNGLAQDSEDRRALVNTVMKLSDWQLLVRWELVRRNDVVPPKRPT